MKTQNRFGFTSDGFIGLIALLICVAIIAILVVRTGMLTPKVVDEEGNKIEGENMIEQGQTAVEKAKDVKSLLEQNSQKDVK